MPIILPPGFETERLVLREAVAADAAAIFAEYASDPEVTRFLSFPTHRSVADAEAFLATCEAARKAGRSNTYVLTRRSDGAVLGVIDLRIETPFRLGFGYVLGRRHWGQGLMPEALAASVRWGAGQAEIWRMWAFCDVANVASARTMEKAGLRFEGVLRRWIVHPNLGPEPRDCRAYAWVREP
ncbi:GNAT family N-acetyltransferase [Limobrevibacterium gyesilva]|uniref:GNAT family N-acetyltransferase n=1 Tax=Limobrevibacterium gyesilva TaxID=2991712 RepID=A0AA41YNG6_9PROT|nr:GNAT family N-acetyltransferase [Limobrevibacterium gyesilva]MCW3475318.1 GNAT family N-acetyltransferase [Limobrevibacterium gyesilva]